MLTRILRSPLVSLTLFLLSLGALFLMKENANPDHSFSPVQIGILAAIAALLTVWALLVDMHNRNNPKERISMLGLFPAELREVDEGHQWVTYRACRNVYIYYSVTLPLAAGASIFIPDLFSKAFIVLAVWGFGQYAVYWLTIRKLNQV